LTKLENEHKSLKKGTTVPRINILGGGISGITTALFLQLCGAKTTLYTDKRPDQIALQLRESSLSSLHAIASVHPQSVRHPQANTLMLRSQNFFAHLASTALCGIRTQRHYQVFEQKQALPEYNDALRVFRELPSDGKGIAVAPKRNKAKEIYGWYFHSFFCEMPSYFRYLYRLYQDIGGTILLGRLTAEEFFSQSADAYINCAGLWSSEIFRDDKQSTRIIRGHWIKVDIDEMPSDADGRLFSYNYHPHPSVYAKADGTAADVYFYPRTDGWILGGSRQEGIMRNGDWLGEETHCAEIEISGIRIPAPVWDLNRQLIKDLTKIDIANYNSHAYIGFRQTRKGDGPSLRLEQAPHPHPQLFHNYGHGGAGVTLSWGCAIELMNLIRLRLGLDFPEIELPGKNEENQFVLSGLARLASEYKQSKPGILS
jgi:D-amino-acid oxidase